MTVNRRKKNVKMRGWTTHGWGARKKHRGAGNRGGRGMAGSGKRADQRKSWIFKEYGNSYFGKKGFFKHNKTIVKSINLSDIEAKLPSLLAQKLVKEENHAYIVDLTDLGYNKLLGSGKITKKFIVTADTASKKAVERVKKLGGEVKISSDFEEEEQ
ncbi:50S ribosomal protein L15 [Candidatus Woesearchaeota archaeon]|nr:50S ribosomal protein L15 [Candidatus Woesearchaeota archaeon]